MYYVYNGRFLEYNEKIQSSPSSDGTMYGYGLFETIKITNYYPEYIDAHLKRLRKGLDALNIGCMYSDEKIKEYIKKLIRKNGFNGALKIAVIKNKNLSDLIIMMKNSTYNYKDYQRGFKLTISSVLRNSTAKLVNYKTLNYLENLLEFKSAKAQGFDEVIFFNEKKYLAEGAITNVFIIKDEILYTPMKGSGLLEGIMRNKVIEKSPFKVVEKNLRIEDLDTADEVFVTNSLMRVMPVRSIKDTEYHQTRFEITEKIRKEL